MNTNTKSYTQGLRPQTTQPGSYSMNGDEKFWLSIWAIVGVFFITLVTAITWGNQETNRKILQADSCAKVVAMLDASRSGLIALCVADQHKPKDR